MSRKRGMIISIAAAIGENGELGKNNALCWRISSDLKRLKALRMDKPIIMGRKTHESIGRALPGSPNIVITKNGEGVSHDCLIATSFTGALDLARHAGHPTEVIIFGGAQVYAEAIKSADRLYLTLIHAEDIHADVFFPEYKKIFTNVIERRKGTPAAGEPEFEYITLERP